MQYGYGVTQGHAAFPAGQGSDNDYNRNWYGMHVAQICDTWKAVWGADFNRVVCLLGAQASDTYSATEALNTPFWTGAGNGPALAHAINAIAIAPYFGNGGVPVAWTTQSDGGLSMLFQSLTTQNDASIPAGGFLESVVTQEAAYTALGKQYNLPIVAYEGGQTFVAGTNTALQNLYYAANRDPRMGTAYTTYLNQWKAGGGGLFIVYNDIDPYSQWGEWGALESIQQVVSRSAALRPSGKRFRISSRRIRSGGRIAPRPDHLPCLCRRRIYARPSGRPTDELIEPTQYLKVMIQPGLARELPGISS